MIKTTKGLDLPIAGIPQQQISDGPTPTRVAVLGGEYIGMRPTMMVQVGEKVEKGQSLFEDKKNPGVYFTAPLAGTVEAINRGEKRVLQSVVVAVDGNESVKFDVHDPVQLASLTREKVQEQLVKSGLWTAIRTRPFSKIPALNTAPCSVFVSAMDTNPLAADPSVIIAERSDDFANGLTVLSRLTDGKVHVGAAPSANLPATGPQVQTTEYTGPHPAGLVGTHIHFQDAAGASKVVWHVGYQDVISIGKLFTTGDLDLSKVISIAGPAAKNPRLIRTVVGASTNELINGEVEGDDVRVISGSVLHGKQAVGPQAFLGRYHNQISLLTEDSEKVLLGWILPGSDKHSVTRAYLGHLNPKRLFNMTTNTNGSDRAMVPIGNYERVMPLDILPTLLLRDLLSGDTDGAQTLGCLELDEEDLALCSYVCPGKYNYGEVLRDCLTQIEKEG